jgi:hypothetical protein
VESPLFVLPWHIFYFNQEEDEDTIPFDGIEECILFHITSFPRASNSAVTYVLWTRTLRNLLIIAVFVSIIQHLHSFPHSEKIFPGQLLRKEFCLLFIDCLPFLLICIYTFLLL